MGQSRFIAPGPDLESMFPHSLTALRYVPGNFSDNLLPALHFWATGSPKVNLAY